MTDGHLPRPREWIGAGPYPWPPIHTLAGGAAVNACFAVVSFQLGRTRQEKSYLKLQLGDRHGVVEGRVWDDAEQFVAWLRPGLYVGVRGYIEMFNGERQLRVETLAPLRVALEELELFVPRSPRDVRVMEDELRALIASLRDAPLRALVERIIGPNGEIARGFRLAPAAKQNHHAYLGGLIEHTLSVTRLCDALAKHYAAEVDRDLLVAAALLHDIGKVREIGAQAGFPYTDEGKLLGHILLGLQIVTKAAAAVPELRPERLLLLQHLIASHQGRYEWQSPREPRILEALLLHYADDLDAKAHQALALINGTPSGWTPWDRSLGRDFFRHRPVIEEAGDQSTTTTSPVDRQHATGRSRNGAHERRGGDATASDAPPTREPRPGDTLDLFGPSRGENR